ncbi:hypothetical protein Tco_1156713 [Tanacetum coccineum]
MQVSQKIDPYRMPLRFGVITSWDNCYSLRPILSVQFDKEEELSSDDESEGDIENAIGDDKETECDHVSETSFAQDHDADLQEVPNCNGHSVNSDDPFEIYKILKRKKDTSAVNGDNQPNDISEDNDVNQPIVSTGNYFQHTPQFPPGFTPDVDKNVAGSGKQQPSHIDSQEDGTSSVNKKKESVVSGLHNHGTKFQASGSILEVMDELIKVGHAMGYNMDGCAKNIESIIGSQGHDTVFR